MLLLYHNIYLLDETILNEHLCDWIRKELGLERLYRRLYKILEDEQGTAEFILAVFKEINYLSHQEFKKLNENLNLIQQQPAVLREKKKGDYLLENKMYVNALRIYDNALRKKIKKDWENSLTEGFTITWDAPICIYSNSRRRQSAFSKPMDFWEPDRP